MTGRDVGTGGQSGDGERGVAVTPDFQVGV